MSAPRLASILLAAGAAAPLFASETATVLGRVIDASGGVVVGASVTARNVETGISRSVVTEADGTYRMPVLPSGGYEFTAHMTGFGAVRRLGVRLNMGAEAILDFELAPASLAEELTVTADAPLVETTNSSVYTVVTREQIAVLPNVGRDYILLMKLAPGVQITAEGANVGGARGRSNSYLLDGVDNGNEISGNRLQGTNLDAVEEFAVLVNTFKAEYGRATGGVLSVVTRSGRNELDGGLYFMYRDERMIAREPYLAPGAPEDRFQRSQYGGFIGGPIRKDRTHGFASFDYTDRENYSTRTLPLPPPGSAVSAVTASFLEENGVAIPFEGGTRRFVRPEYLTIPRFSARLDHAASQHHHLTLIANWERERLPSGASGTIYDTQGYDDVDTRLSVQLNHKWIRSPAHLNELYVKVGREKFKGVPDRPDLINISIDEAGGMYLGSNPDRPWAHTDHYLQVVDNYTIHKPTAWKGSHVLKLGVDGKLFRSDSVFDANFRGTFFFRTVSDFLAGDPRLYTGQEGDSTLDNPTTTVGLYAQDDWTLNPHLTLNLGLRWDYERGTVEALRDVPAGSAVCAYTDRCGRAGTANSDDYDNFAPRFGFVWDPRGDGRTAIHGGAGLYYDQVILNIQGNARFTPPKVESLFILDPSFPDPLLGGTVSSTAPSVQIVDEALVTPYSFRTSLGVKRQLTTNVAGDLTFFWSRGFDQVVRGGINPIDPATGRRPNPDFTGISLYTNEGTYDYSALTVELRRRAAGRFQGGVSYTLSRTSNNGDTFLSGYQFPRQKHRSWGPADEDRRHVVVADAVVTLPWSMHLGATLDFRSELPLNVFAGGVDIDRDGNANDYPHGYDRNQVRELSLVEANRLRAEFNRPPIAEFQDNAKYFNVNATLQKRVRLLGEGGLRLKIEVFNLFNRPNHARPISSITSALFGQRTALDAPREARMRSLQLTGMIDF